MGLRTHPGSRGLYHLCLHISSLSGFRSQEYHSEHNGFGNNQGKSLVMGRNTVTSATIPLCVGQSARRSWSFATRFTPKGPDRFYLHARPEQQTNESKLLRSTLVNEDSIAADIEMMSLGSAGLDAMIPYVIYLFEHFVLVESLIGCPNPYP